MPASFLSFQEMITALQAFWSTQGCTIMPTYDLEMGAGTFHPATVFRALGRTPWRCAFLQPARRPTDGRYGQNPNRVYKHHQFQVILKPSPSHLQSLVYDSLAATGLNLQIHDLRFIEDNWSSPTLGAAGTGWEVRCDGLEVLQVTYFQQIAGRVCAPILVELTYGLERLATVLQDQQNIYDVIWSHAHEGQPAVLYRDLFHAQEVSFSHYHFTHSNPEQLQEELRVHMHTAKTLASKLPWPAYEALIKANHTFNALEARGGLSVAMRTSYIQELRALAHNCIHTWYDQNHACDTKEPHAHS